MQLVRNPWLANCASIGVTRTPSHLSPSFAVLSPHRSLGWIAPDSVVALSFCFVLANPRSSQSTIVDLFDYDRIHSGLTENWSSGHNARARIMAGSSSASAPAASALLRPAGGTSATTAFSQPSSSSTAPTIPSPSFAATRNTCASTICLASQPVQHHVLQHQSQLHLQQQPQPYYQPRLQRRAESPPDYYPGNYDHVGPHTGCPVHSPFRYWLDEHGVPGPSYQSYFPPPAPLRNLAQAGQHPLHLSQEFNPRPPRPISRSLHRRNTQPVRRRKGGGEILSFQLSCPSPFHPVSTQSFGSSFIVITASQVDYVTRLEVFPGHLL